jgi:hypothetical protein
MMPGCMSPDMLEEIEQKRREQREKDAREQDFKRDSTSIERHRSTDN